MGRTGPLTKLTGDGGIWIEGGWEEWGSNRREGIFQLTKLTGDGHIDGGGGRFADANGVVGTDAELVSEAWFQIADHL